MIKACMNRDGTWKFTGERDMGGLYSSKKETELQSQLASLALALEALETILVEKGILLDGQVMKEALRLAQKKMTGARFNG